jgi:hypothetical protein
MSLKKERLAQVHYPQTHHAFGRGVRFAVRSIGK